MGRFLSRSARKVRLARKSRAGRLKLEALEDRRLLAADLTSLTIDTDDYRADSLIVQFRDGTSSPGSLAAHVATRRLDAEWSIAPGMRRVQLDPASDVASVLAAYKNDPNVVFAEPDFRVSLQRRPNDEQFHMLYGLENVGANGALVDADIDPTEAWDVTVGSRSTIVAIIDTGVDYNHPDLRDNIWTNQAEADGVAGRDDDGNGYVDDIHGYDFANRDGDPMDDHFHGTHVAGTIGAVGDNGIGITGVAWQVQIMALKFLDASGGGYTSDAIAALNYAVANGARVSNNSWGGGTYSAAFEQAVKNAATRNHIFVAAAGNDGWNNDLDAFYPAGYNKNNGNVISIAATDNQDQLAWFSNYGVNSVNLAAPGVNIYSTFPTRMTDAMRADGFSTHYESISGTSMATPHVSGALALVLTQNPGLSYVEAIEKVTGTVDLVDGALKTISGGRLNAAAALGNAPPDANGPRIVSHTPSGGVTGTVGSVRLQFSEAIDPSTVSLADIVSFIGPGGDITATSIDPVAGNTRQFTVTFDPQTALGDYTLAISGDIADASGNLMDQDRDGTGAESPDDHYVARFQITDVISFPSTDVPAPVSWGSVTSSFLNIDQNITISDLNVSLDLTYPYDFDLRLYLESPSGTEVILSYENGGMDADYWGTKFDDEAPQPVINGFAPFTGSYQPEQALSAFDGENASGTWTLRVEAWFNSGADGLLWGDGWIEAWSVEIEGGSGGNPPPPPPPPPNNRPPVAVDDTIDGEMNTRIGMTPTQLLANDSDPDPNTTLSIQFVGQPVNGSVALGNGVITFEPDRDFQGQASFQYIVTDGALSDIGTVTLNVGPLFRWHNATIAEDVNRDNKVTGADALAIINVLNAIGPTPLEFLFTDGVDPDEFLDVQPDNTLKPTDALAVINYINAGFTPGQASSLVASEGESSGAAADSSDIQCSPVSHDAALLSLLASEAAESTRRTRGRH